MALAPFPSVHEGTSSERSIMARVGIVGGIVIVLLAIFVARFATPPNHGFTGGDSGSLGGDAAAVLAMVSLVAVGIERLIEMLWSLIASFKNGWWPLPEIAKAVDDLVEDANQVARPAFEAAIAGLEGAKKAEKITQDEVDRLDAEIRNVEAEAQRYVDQIKQISSLAKDNQRVQLVATTAFQAANRLDTAYGDVMPRVRQAFNDVSQVTTGVSDILAGFKENPAKKLISIMIGTFVGLIVAGFAGLDLFQAAGLPLGPTTADAIKASAFPYVGVMLTGLVVGLGANPTHEVVRLVSEAAKARRASNLARPNISGSPDDRDEQATAKSAGAGAASAIATLLGGGFAAAPADPSATGGGPAQDEGAASPVLGRVMGVAGLAPTRAVPGSMNLR
jgi:hypothetical protein